MGINPYARYQKVQVETADQGKLLLMLYTGALRFIGSAKRSIKEGDLEGVNRNLLRSEDIITELMAALNLEAGGVAGNLFQLYDYVHYLLVQGNIKKEVRFLEEAEVLLAGLLEAWKKILGDKGGAEQSREETPGPAGLQLTAGAQERNVPGDDHPEKIYPDYGLGGPGGKRDSLVEKEILKEVNVSG